MRSYESIYDSKSEPKMVLTLDLLHGDTAWIITPDDHYYYYGHPTNDNLFLQMSLGERTKRDYNFRTNHKAWAAPRKSHLLRNLTSIGTYFEQDESTQEDPHARFAIR